jgi:hypothetical protein
MEGKLGKELTFYFAGTVARVGLSEPCLQRVASAYGKFAAPGGCDLLYQPPTLPHLRIR